MEQRDDEQIEWVCRHCLGDRMNRLVDILFWMFLVVIAAFVYIGWVYPVDLVTKDGGTEKCFRLKP
jgi:hypothetical protein